MKTLTKIKQWLTNTELAKTLKYRDVIDTIKLPVIFTLLLLTIHINFLQSTITFLPDILLLTGCISILDFILSDKILISFLIVIFSSIYYILCIHSDKEGLRNHSQVVLTMIVLTCFELLYIWSYSPKMMIPENIMELILISLPVFKFCVFIYVVTLNRIANENTTEGES